MNQNKEDEPSTSTNPVLELELTEEKLPMTLSRQEVSHLYSQSFSPHSFTVYDTKTYKNKIKKKKWPALYVRLLDGSENEGNQSDCSESLTTMPSRDSGRLRF